MKKVMMLVVMVVGIMLVCTGCNADKGKKYYPELTEEQNRFAQWIDETHEPRVYHDKEHGLKVTFYD